MGRLAVLLVASLAACSGAAATGGSTPEPTAGVGPPPGPAQDSRTLYRGGKPYTPPHAGEDRYTCYGSPADEEACQAVGGASHPCVLQPPVAYWEGEPRCRGDEPEPEELQRARDCLQGLPIPACVCGCTDEYARAADTFGRRLAACANVP